MFHMFLERALVPEPLRNKCTLYQEPCTVPNTPVRPTFLSPLNAVGDLDELLDSDMH